MFPLPCRKLTLRKKPAPLRDEQGAVFLYIAVTLAAIIAVTAIVIDIGREQIAARQLKNAAESSALTGAKILNGTKEGWLDAKRAVVAALKQQALYQATTPLSSGLQLSGGLSDPEDNNGAYRGTEANIGNVVITVERGVFWTQPDQGDKFRFESLEGSANRLKYGLPSYLIANAVRVTLTMKDIKTIFGGIFSIIDGSSNISSFGDVSRESMSVSDQRLETCVLPIAVPACSMLLDLDEGNNNKYNTDAFLPDEQCVREFVGTAEVEPRDFSERVEGFLRSEFYPARPASAINKGRPGQGLLGVAPRGTPFGQTATGAEVLGVLNESGGCRDVRLGAAFKPIENAVQGQGGVFNDPITVNNLQNRLADLINSGQPFNNVFAGANRPQLRPDTQRNTTAPNRPEVVVLGRKNSANYTNLLCHNTGVPINSPGTHNVREAYIMLIGNNDRSADKQYCNFAADYTQPEISVSPPKADTQPRVVGFLKMNLFDFNFDNLSTQFSLDDTPQYSGFRDNNPAGLFIPGLDTSVNNIQNAVNNYNQAVTNYQNALAQWRAACNAECVARCQASPPPSDPTCTLSCPYANPDTQCSLAKPQPPATPTFDLSAFDIFSLHAECFVVPSPSVLNQFEAALNQAVTGQQLTVNFPPALLQCVTYPGCPPIPGTHCFWRYLGNPGAWEVVDHRAQYGCGGVRMRMSCDSTQNLIYPTLTGEQRPVIVVDE